MKEYDVIIIGSGAGATLIGDVLEHGKSLAFIDKGPVGGTCLNVGCIPTKLLVYPADRIVEIREAKKFGISAEIKSIDFKAVMERMRHYVKEGTDGIKEAFDQSKDFDFYYGHAKFIADYTLEVNDQHIKGKTIFLISGARPFVPPIKGIETIPFLTNETVLQLTEKPQSLVIIGGGYVAVEFAHFFEAMGVKVTIIQRNKRLLPEEEPEISELIQKILSRRMTIHTAAEVIETSQKGKVVNITYKDVDGGAEHTVVVEKVLIAAGRKSNADLLTVENTGVRTNENGYVIVDDYGETTKKNIWSFGDAIGKQMFRHAANYEAEIVWQNAEHGKKHRINFLSIPHAVFTYPEIASVGLTEQQATKLLGKHNVLVGKAKYLDVARGEAMMETEGFAKAVVHKDSEKILGYHIIGPHASILIQEVANAMATDGTIWSLAKGIHIHPALSEVVLKAFSKLKELE